MFGILGYFGIVADPIDCRTVHKSGQHPPLVGFCLERDKDVGRRIVLLGQSLYLGRQHNEACKEFGQAGQQFGQKRFEGRPILFVSCGNACQGESVHGGTWFDAHFNFAQYFTPFHE